MIFSGAFIKRLPSKGQIGIFNRSHYEDVLITRVHGMGIGQGGGTTVKSDQRIRRTAPENGTTILKFFLHISKDEQKERLEERISRSGEALEIQRRGSRRTETVEDYMEVFEEVTGGHQHRSMRPGISCRPIGNGIGISWSPIVSLTRWKT